MWPCVCVLLRHVCPSQVDSQHQVHLLQGRLQGSRQTDGAGVVHQDVDSCQSDTLIVMMSRGGGAPSPASHPPVQLRPTGT